MSTCRNVPDSHRVRWLATVPLLTIAACSYDLDRLRGRDVTTSDIDDTISADAEDTTPPDTMPGDATDAPPQDVPPACSNPAVLDVGPAVGTQFGATWRIINDTTGGPSDLTPPCVDAGAPTSELMYRYVVQQGPRLYATTDAPMCAGIFDTILYARTACEPAQGTALGCNDDDMVLSPCGSPASLASSLLLDNLVPGQSVYLVVDGYGGNSGPFRLSITENGLPNERIPALNLRCSCPSGVSLSTVTVQFPSGTDEARDDFGSAISSLTTVGDHVSGAHSIPTIRSVVGAGLDLTVLSNTLTCGTSPGYVTFDLNVDNQNVQSFRIDPDVRTDRASHVTFVTFGSFSLVNFPTTIELRLRSMGGCTGGVSFANDGRLTLLGGTR